MPSASHHDIPPSPCATAPLIGGFTAGCVLVSNVIGGGIFTSTGFMARDLGDPWLILMLWGSGALFALAGALSYAEMAAALPQVGGEYVYITEAYGPLLGYLSGWASFTVGFGAAIAAAAASFAAYFLELFSARIESDLPARGLALLLVWGLTAVHLTGVGPGGLLQRLLTITKVASILLLAGGAFLLGHGSWEHLAPAGPGATPSVGTMAVSFIFVVYAYSGWNAVGYIAGEIRNPGRTIPIALTWGTVFVGLVYLMLNLVYFYALPVDVLARPPILPVAEKAAVALFGSAAAQLITGMLCVSIATAVSAMIWVGPRVYYAMAKDGRLPAFLGRSRAKGGAPTAAILVQTAWASVLIVSGTFEQLIIYTGIILGVFSALAVGSVIILRRRQPMLPRPYRVPGYPLTPCAYLAGAVCLVLYAAIERPMEAVLGLMTVLAGVPLYFLQHGNGLFSRFRPLGLFRSAEKTEKIK
jgi:basic amino acid/polyamine antiporter, APA family